MPTLVPDSPQHAGLFDRSGAVRRPPLRLLVRNLADFCRPPDRRGAARLLATAPRGDGHPVLVLPAFLKGDASTLYLRRFLAALGYESYGWRLGINIGPTAAALEGTEQRLRALRRRHAGKVSLIGHSLGGVIAREAAKKAPGSVRQLVTLCSPFTPPIASNVELAFRLFAPWHSRALPTLWADLGTPAPVPTTAIYTLSDGIVSWTSCVEQPGPQRESIEVAGCHTTMASNTRALAIIADRLAQPDGTWRPFVS
jgi:pimeloyl-ACP methyl ester carboxylesterase